MLLRARQRLGAGLALGVRAVEAAHVGVDLEQAALLLGVDRGGQHRVDGALRLVGRDVEAEREPAQALEAGRPAARVAVAGVEAHALALGGGGRVVERLDRHQRAARRHLHVRGREHLAHAAADRRGQRRLHLHALGHRDDVAGLHLVALRDADRDDDAGRVAAHEAALVARDAVRDAVDLDEQVLVLQRGHRAERAPAVGEAALVLGDPFDVGLDAGVVDLDEVARRADLADAEAIARAAVQQVDGPADVRLGVRAAAPRERVEVRALGRRGGVAERDRRLHERGVGVAQRLHLVVALEAVEPARVGLAAAQLGAPEQLEQEALVGRALVDHHHRVGDRAAQARDRLRAAAAVGDDLRDHRVELRRHRVALRDAGVDAHAGPAREAQQRDPPGRGREPAAGILGVQAHLDRVAVRRRRVALEPAAGRDVELERDEVGAGDHLGDGVLDLQPGVDLHEREALLARLVEELDGARAAVVRVSRQAHRRLGQLALLLGRERRARRLLDDLLVAALVAAVAHAERPHPALPVGHQLDLDVARVADQALDQHARVAEGLLGLGAGALERVRQSRPAVVDAAHAAPAAAGGGLDHQRVAELLTDGDGVLGALHRRRRSTPRPARRPARPGAWPRSCRPARA